MKTRLPSFLVVLVLLAVAPTAAHASGGRGVADRLTASADSARAPLDRRLAAAMARMDENLLALLSPATLDCAGDFVESGLETCIVRLDTSLGAAAATSD